MKPINELLNILKQKLIKEETDLKNIRQKNIFQDLYDLISIYTDEPYNAFTKDEAELLAIYLHRKGYRKYDHQINLQVDLKMLENYINELDDQNIVICYTSSVGELEISYEIVKGKTLEIIETPVSIQKKRIK